MMVDKTDTNVRHSLLDNHQRDIQKRTGRKDKDFLFLGLPQKTSLDLPEASGHGSLSIFAEDINKSWVLFRTEEGECFFYVLSL